jgi:hypothetical protein
VTLPTRAEQFWWGILGATAALAFAIWMFFFPDSVARLFAWDVHPRLSQAFIGAGYVFRTAFFLSVAFERDWLRLRWLYWGNFAFTGTLLFATFWHAPEFNWDPSQTLLAHLWLILYIFEPVTMIYMVPRGMAALPAPAMSGPILRPFRIFLIGATGLLLSDGLLLLINPEFTALRWPWELNPLDARIIAAWFLGWAVWLGTMALARDWAEIRLPSLLFLLNGAALLATIAVFNGEFRPGGTTGAYQWGIGALTVVMAIFVALQEVRRRRSRA